MSKSINDNLNSCSRNELALFLRLSYYLTTLKCPFTLGKSGLFYEHDNFGLNLKYTGDLNIFLKRVTGSQYKIYFLEQFMYALNYWRKCVPFKTTHPVISNSIGRYNKYIPEFNVHWNGLTTEDICVDQEKGLWIRRLKDRALYKTEVLYSMNGTAKPRTNIIEVY